MPQKRHRRRDERTAVDPEPFMRDLLKWLLAQAVSCKNLNEWFGLLVKQMINVAYGKAVFELPD